MFLQWDINDASLHREYIELCELEFETNFNDIVKNLASNDKLKVLTVAGPTSSGKTTVSLKLASEMKKYGKNVKIISMDDFYRESSEIQKKEDGQPNFELLEALDTERLIRCIDEAINKGVTRLPKFDFRTGKKNPDAAEFTLGESEIMIMEGLHGLNPKITSKLPNGRFKGIYITIGEKIFLPRGVVFSKRDVRFLRRLVRDYKFRNAEPELTFELWETVRESESLYIFPYEPFADVRINSLYKYEICALKEPAVKLLSTIGAGSKFYEKAKRLIDMFAVVPEIDHSLIPPTSLVREFLGDSIYYKQSTKNEDL